VQCCIAALHTVSFVHCCFTGKCILTGSTEQILQGRWEHGEKVGYCYPSGLENTLFKWDIYVSLVTKALITANNLNDLQTKLNPIINYMSAWFAVNGLSFNIEKINIVKFSSNHFQNDLFQLCY
jgi:hypothetical protein